MSLTDSGEKGWSRHDVARFPIILIQAGWLSSQARENCSISLSLRWFALITLATFANDTRRLQGSFLLYFCVLENIRFGVDQETV